ncbi:TniB family NTP-binding protein [Dolichospermum sp. LEGE 00240]|uniref:TniB family NTP-binding protein n=1 Tax=Dolichospermum sp. LEGE 00240 TaxID=1828603 RepID=UPI001D146CB2|nr:TniB family NTP-binding protein [Dolichospermum sp. LEGE 00240]
MTQSGKVQSSQSGKDKLKAAYKKAGFTIATLAEAAKASEDQIKYLIGQNTQKVTAVDRYVIENVLNAINQGLENKSIVEKLTPSDIVDDWFPRLIPTEFQIVIDDKTKLFCGRKFVFNAISEFIKDHKSGYFTILGDAGMGKSAIAAKYIVDHPGTICFFNIRAEGRNRHLCAKIPILFITMPKCPVKIELRHFFQRFVHS